MYSFLLPCVYWYRTCKVNWIEINVWQFVGSNKHVDVYIFPPMTSWFDIPSSTYIFLKNGYGSWFLKTAPGSAKILRTRSCFFSNIRLLVHRDLKKSLNMYAYRYLHEIWYLSFDSRNYHQMSLFIIWSIQCWWCLMYLT